MANTMEYMDEITEVARLAKDFELALKNAIGGSFVWGVEQVAESYKSMFERFCPHTVGGRVKLKKSVRNDKVGQGRSHCLHFLKKGATATVSGIGYRDGMFVFDIVFDDETWIDCEGREREPSEKHTFLFSEKEIEAIK